MHCITFSQCEISYQSKTSLRLLLICIADYAKKVVPETLHDFNFYSVDFPVFLHVVHCYHRLAMTISIGYLINVNIIIHIGW